MHTILIVDDDPAGRDFLVALLRHQGHRLLTAWDGAEALALVRAEKPDLVIADILMPTMDGYEFVRQLRTDPEVAATQVMFYSASYHQQEAHALAQACGVKHLIQKPAEPEVILQAVEAILSGKPAAPPEPPSGEFEREHLRLLTDRLAREVQELAEANARLAALLEVGRQLALERDRQRMVDAFCEKARDVIGAKYAFIGMLDGAAEFGRVHLSGVAAEALKELRLPSPGEGVVSRLLSAGRPIRSQEPGPAREISGFPPSGPGEPLGEPLGGPLGERRSFLGVPVLSPTETYGVLCLAGKLGADAFSDQDEQVAVTLAAQLAVAYESARRYEELQKTAERQARLFDQVQSARGRLQQLSRQLLTAQEAERRRLARELHDEIGQALTALKMNLFAIRRTPDSASTPTRLEESLAVIEETLQKVRNLSLDLRPSLLDDLGLVSALRWHLDQQARRVGFAVQLVAEEPFAVKASPEIETACFRVVQEALTNIARHAQARNVRVEIRQKGPDLLLCVEDDGVGFDVPAARERAIRGASLGLLGMQERVTLLNGEFSMESAAGAGTRIQARFPLS